MFRKVEQQRGVGRVCGDEEAAVRLTLGRREQSEVGGEDTVWEGSQVRTHVSHQLMKGD